MVTRRRGDRGHRVLIIQRIIGADPDGIFGAETDHRVLEFQQQVGLLEDGVVGRQTWDKLYHHAEQWSCGPPIAADLWGRTPIERVSLDNPLLEKWVQRGVSYSGLRLRASLTAEIRAIQSGLQSRGATLTTSGGTRSLTANVGKNRSAMSRHYLGGAIDLGVYTGMVNLNQDPFIVERDGRVNSTPRTFRVWARVSSGGNTVTVNALDRDGGEIEITIEAIDLTAVMAEHGFTPIPCRRRTWDSLGEGRKIENAGGLEWWHFQAAVPLMVKGETTWGEALLGLYSYGSLVGTPPWNHRFAVFGQDWSAS